ncbi:MAG: hypothetical protein MUP80_06380 [Acidobacteriia bacterium]|nr:hypothetical protein [Terriglobia bacterium]
MGYFKKIAIVLAAVFGITGLAGAQRMAQAPSMPGEFKPVVGAGAQYEVTTKKNEKVNWAYAVVGKETVGGAEGYWLEMRLEGGKEGGMVMKHLLVVRGGKAEVKRMIVQTPGQPPMEMPMGMMGGMMPRGQQAASEQNLGERVGTETVTVPAGTFLCDHYRSKSGKTPADVWVSTKISPYGLVKMVSEDSTLVLTKVLANETTRIKGEPQKLEMPHF